MKITLSRHRVRLFGKYVSLACAFVIVTVMLVQSSKFAFYRDLISMSEGADDIAPSLVFPGRLDLKEEITRRADSSGTILIPAVIDGGYAETALNFHLTSIQRLGLTDHTLFLCVDRAACAESQQLGVPAMMYKQSHSDITDVFNSKSFIEKAMTKHFIIYEILLMGHSVLLTDLDMYWFKSPMEDVRKLCGYCDFAIQNEANEGLNIGFVFVRPTKTSLAFYENLLRAALAGTESGAQTLFNDLFKVHKHELKYKILAIDSYPDGQTYFEKHKRILPGQNPCVNCFIMHNNWIVGTEAKRYRFREHLMWQVDTDGYYSDPDRKYISYANDVTETGLVEEYERQALYSALAIAEVLGRTLILPRVFTTATGKRQTMNGVAIIKQFEKGFGGRFRESSFLSNELVPQSTRVRSCGKFLIDSQFYDTYRDVMTDKQIRQVFTPKDRSKGATETELLEWFSGPEFQDCMVLDFHSLYRSFGGFTDSFKQKDFLTNFKEHFISGGYRQKRLLSG